jgi:antitoxin ParD1/3/4
LETAAICREYCTLVAIPLYLERSGTQEGRMNVSVEDRWQALVDKLVKSGRFGSASEVVGEGLRLIEERERKLQDLRDTINRSIERGGSLTPEEVDAHLDARAAEWKAKGY